MVFNPVSSTILLISAAAAAITGVIAVPQSSTSSSSTAATSQISRLLVSKNLGPSNSTMCIDAATTQAVNCTGVASQLFSFTIAPTTTANVVSLGAISNNNNLCLDATGSSGNGGAGTALQQIACQTTGFTQKWIYHFGTFTIRPYYNIQLCLDATGGSGGLTGPNLVVNNCFSSTTGLIATQQWVYL